jgi:uncharacterized membrane protein
LVSRASRWTDLHAAKTLWLRFAARIVIALELTLAADIISVRSEPATASRPYLAGGNLSRSSSGEIVSQ